MRAYFCYTLLLILSHIPNVYSQDHEQKNIYVALSLDDCVNCNIYWREVVQKLNDPKVNFILSSELESDSQLVNMKTGINNYKNGTIIYSDSLYNIYSKGVRSTIVIANNGKPIYTDYLYNLDVNKFIEQYNSINSSKCYQSLKKGIQYIQRDETLLIYNTQFSRWTYYYAPDKSKDILADSLWMKKAYQVYYGKEKWLKEYNKADKLVKEYPNMLPTITYGVKSDNKLQFICNIKFLTTDIKKGGITVIQKLFLADYDYMKNTFTNFYYINDENLAQKGYYLNSSGFTVENDEYLFPINSNDDPVENTKFLSVFKKNKDQLELDRILPVNIPSNYIQYKLKNNFHNYNFSSDFVCLKFGEFIYDWKNDIQYPIPFSNEEFDSLKKIYDITMSNNSANSYYYIRDISDANTKIQILYRSKSGELKLVIIDKKTKKLIKDAVIIKADDLKNYKNPSSFYFNNETQLIYIDNNNCISYLNL